jgi:hypothetical protein
MPEGLSHRIVGFISNLAPLYDYEVVNGVGCARSLSDGTLILPMDEAKDDEPCFVTVHWQGDPARRSEVLGVELASLAVIRYVELQSVASGQPAKSEYARLAEHFTFKTGGSLMLEGPDEDLALFELVGRAAKTLGKEALMALIKAKLGL